VSEQAQQFAFQAEVQRLLDLVVHSLYTDKEIFLRELVSNASDAIDRLRFEALTRPDLLPEGHDPKIRLVPDREARTLSIEDDGIGMTRDEVVRNIGTIARSGTREALEALKERSEEGAGQLIGQFGVGFYSSFMVADRVELVTRKAGEDGAVRWVSSGDGSFTVEEAERDRPGTTVTLHLKPWTRRTASRTTPTAGSSRASSGSTRTSSPTRCSSPRRSRRRCRKGRPRSRRSRSTP
jgi:molecular chaperone HtpG